jgi:hypothetical protein
MGDNHLHPLLQSLYPSDLEIVPPNVHLDSDGWIVGTDFTGNNSFFRAQWIQCSYEISGGYGPTPRYIYYFLALLSVVARRQSWVIDAALGYVMVYSSTAAVHALVLAGMRTLLAPHSMVANYEVALVQGASPTGRITDDPVGDDAAAPVWMPILPMAWDNDTDPALAIVATAFFLLLPMQVWSETLRRAGTRQKQIIFAWAFLLFAGLIAALIATAYVFFHAFPQVRFCPTDSAESLPLTSTGVSDNIPAWDGTDRYRWNRTVADYFVHKSGTGPTATECFYPCFGTSWPLRERAEIYVVESSFGQALENNLGHAVLLATYAVVAIFTAASVTVACLANMSSIPPDWRPLDIQAATVHIKTSWNTRDKSLWGRLWRFSLRVWVFCNLIVARILSPFVIVGFIGAIEWYMWTVDPGGESFVHVGQWGVLVGALVVLLVATVPGLLSSLLHSRLVRVSLGPVLRRMFPQLHHHLGNRRFKEPDLEALKRPRTA